MIHVQIGDIFESQAQTLVNTVNCVGIMGKGVALEFKKRFPDMYEDYVGRCERKEVRLGEPYLYRRLTPPGILNFPTKDHWRSVSRLADIVAGLEFLKCQFRQWGITSLACPPLGCGHGQLEWRVVGRTLYRHLAQLEIPVELFAPFGTPPDELQDEFLARPADSDNGAASVSKYAPKIRPQELALVEVLARIEREPYHWPVGRTMFQKIAYFTTESGVATGLRYSRGSYGPFSPDLKPLLGRLTNNGLIREERFDRMFAVRTGSTYADAAKAFSSDLATWNKVLDRVADLFLRMKTQDAEIAATVHFAAKSEPKDSSRKATEMEVLEAVRKWRQKRKPPLKDEDVARAIRSLNLLRWVDLTPSKDLPLPEDALADV
jgi:O-acetyl-ADP-ribose deacetylase (regulator of RNase III)/uncharacterized protein YwgA